jgi:hypothetical protein
MQMQFYNQFALVTKKGLAEGLAEEEKKKKKNR